MHFNDLPRHLILGGNRRYYFRIAVPKKLRAIIGKTEIKKALKTSDEILARKLAISYALHYEIYFEQLKASPAQSASKSIDPFAGQPIPLIINHQPATMLNNLLTGFTLNFDVKADGSKKVKVQFDPNQPEAEKALYEAFVQSGGLDKISDAIASAPPPNAVTATPTAPPTPPSPMLSEAINQFFKQQTATGQWTTRTELGYRSIFDTFLEIGGDRPIAEFTKNDAVAVKQILLNWPKNRKKMPAYRDLTAKQIQGMTIPPADRITIQTINEYLTQFRAFFSWAENHATAQPKCFDGLKLKGKKERSIDKRLPFDRSELTTIFTNDIYTAPARKHHSYQYWIPLLALHTGARLEELASLHRDDFQEREGHFVISINEANGRKLKNGNAVRDIPIHPELIRLGFDSFVKSRQDALFPELRIDRHNRRGDTVTDWFARFRKGLGIDGTKKTFHSFRHTFINTLKQQPGIEVAHIEALAGHEPSKTSQTIKTYGDRFDSALLYTVVTKLDFSKELANVKRRP